MNIFVKDGHVKNVVLDYGNDGINYITQALTVRAADVAYRYARIDVGDYIRERYHYSDEAQKFVVDNLTREQLIEFDILNDTPDISHKLTMVLVASEQGWKPADVLEWFLNEPEFFDNCYEAAIQLNPKFAPVEEAPNTAETREAATIKN